MVSLLETLVDSNNLLCYCCVGGCNIEGEEDGWDFGTGAGFYVNATEEKWKTNYRMYSYIVDEVCISRCD